MITVAILLSVFALLVLSIGFISYSLYNMTTKGLINALSILGFSILLDILAIRVLVISL